MASSYSFLEDFVPRLLSEWNIPGASVAVVQGTAPGDARVVFARGFGLREAGQPVLVDEHTLFAVGSLTKAFTAAAVGLLVEERKLGWDDPVLQHLPGFQLFDPVATREITVRDLLCHRSGLGTFAGDWIWYGSNRPAAEVLRRARYLEPAFRLGAGFGYCNIAYIAAGQIIAAVSGTGYEAFLRQRFFQPLGMARSTTSIHDLPALENVASPHQVFEGQLRAIPYRSLDNAAPAGCILSSAWDMAQWLGCLLNGGKAGETHLLSAATLETLWTHHTLLPVTAQTRQLNPSRHFSTYGLGWNLTDNRGRLVLSHTGGIDGMQALALLLPEESTGLIILTNRIPHSATAAISQTLIDRLAGAAEKDWSTVLQEMDHVDLAAAQAARQKQKETRAAGTHSALPLSAYAGAYHNPAIGDLSVAEEDGRLVLRPADYPGLRGILEHWHYNTFRCCWSDPTFGECLVPFQINLSGEVESLKVQVDPFIDPVVYLFIPDPD